MPRVKVPDHMQGPGEFWGSDGLVRYGVDGITEEMPEAEASRLLTIPSFSSIEGDWSPPIEAPPIVETSEVETITKREIADALKALNIPFNPRASKADLQALLEHVRGGIK